MAALLVVGLTDGDHAASAMWGGVVAVFVAAVPMTFTVHGVRMDGGPIITSRSAAPERLMTTFDVTASA